MSHGLFSTDPHQRMLGHIYVDGQVLEKMEEEQQFWEQAWGAGKGTAVDVREEGHNRTMFEYEENLVFYAQKYVSGLLERKASNSLINPMWASKSLDLRPDDYGLIVSKDNKRVFFTFTKAELIEGIGTDEWEGRLMGKVNKILKRIER